MFHLTIKTDNAAFHEHEVPGRFQYDAPALEVARILRKVATDLERGSFDGPCIDANGNGVGRFALDLEDAKAARARPAKWHGDRMD